MKLTVHAPRTGWPRLGDRFDVSAPEDASQAHLAGVYVVTAIAAAADRNGWRELTLEPLGGAGAQA